MTSKESIAEWLEQKVMAAGDLPGEIAKIIERYRELGIPCFEAELERQASDVALFKRSVTSFDDLEKNLPQAPNLVVITVGSSKPAKTYKETIFWNTRGLELIRTAVGHERPVDACRELHAALSDKPLGYKVYAYLDGACLEMSRLSLLSLLLSPVEVKADPEDADEYEVDDDEYEDEDYEGPLMTSDQITVLAEKLAAAEGWGLAKNREQRRYFARKLVGDDESVDQFSLYDAVERANVIYDMDVLPAKAGRLHEEGKTAREISEITGCSQARAKSIVANLPKDRNPA